jgi:hypothetical protein
MLTSMWYVATLREQALQCWVVEESRSSETGPHSVTEWLTSLEKFLLSGLHFFLSVLWEGVRNLLGLF